MKFRDRYGGLCLWPGLAGTGYCGFRAKSIVKQIEREERWGGRRGGR